MPATIYNGFETETAGSQASGLINLSGTWQVTASNKTQGANGYIDTTGSDGDLALFTGMAPTVDQCIQFEQIFNVGAAYPSSGGGRIMQAGLRMTPTAVAVSGLSGYATGIDWSWNGSAGMTIYFLKIASGSVSILSNTTFGTLAAAIQATGCVNGDTIVCKFQVKGTSSPVLSVKFWKKGQPEPSAWIVTYTDTANSFTAAGVVGLRHSLSGPSPVGTATVDELYVGPPDIAFGNAYGSGLTTTQDAELSSIYSILTATPTPLSSSSFDTTALTALSSAAAAATMAASFLTIPGSHTTSGTAETLTFKQWMALMDAMPGGDNTDTTPIASGTATTTYYLRGAAKISANIVAVATVTYDASKNQAGRSVLTAQPFPAVS